MNGWPRLRFVSPPGDHPGNGILSIKVIFINKKSATRYHLVVYRGWLLQEGPDD
jgi:hypothetical protein